MSTSPVLSIIVVSYNTQALTLNCLESVLTEIKDQSSLRNKTELIVVDNHSTDGSIDAVKQLHSKFCQIKLISNQKNWGFAKANNQGIEQSRGKYIFLLNSDTEIKPGAISTLVTTLEHQPQTSTAQLSSYRGVLDKIGILAAKLINPDGSVQPQGGSLPTLWSVFAWMSFLDDLPLLGSFLPSVQHTGLRGKIRLNSFGLFKKKASKKHKALELNSAELNPGSSDHSSNLIQKGWVGATAMLIDRRVIAEIGLLDENIFMYGEDVEFCLRAQHHHWDVAIQPEAEVIHLGSASSSSENAILGEFEGYVYIWSKHKPAWQLPLLKRILWFGAWLRATIIGKILKQKQRKGVYRQAMELVSA